MGTYVSQWESIGKHKLLVQYKMLMGVPMKKIFIIGLVLLMTVITSNIAYGANSDSTRVGLGSGDSYGNFGTNLEYYFGDYFAITTGVGINPDGLGWSAGGRIYLAGKTRKVRPRLGYYFGSVYKKTDHFERINGFKKYIDTTYQTAIVNMAGIALDIKISDKVTLDPELLYVLYHDVDDDFQERVSFSMGLHW